MRNGELERFEAKLAEVLELAAERLPPEENAAFAAALARFYANVSPDDVEEATAEQIYGAALALWRFTARRRPGEAKVRLYNPQLAEHGWESPHTVLESVTDDMPFIVDSVTNCLTERGLGIHALIHPILEVFRDDEGRRLGLAEPGAEGAIRESVLQAQIDQIASEEARESLRAAIAGVLADVRAAVTDWKPMLARLAEVTREVAERAPRAGAEGVEEVVEFLEWLAADHFTFLGYRAYELLEGGGARAIAESGLGLMRDPAYTVLRDADGNPVDWSPEMDAFVSDTSPLLIIKANRRSTVHRAAHLDLIGVKRYDPEGRVIGEHVFIGLFTSAAYNRSPRAIPLLRQKVERIIARAGFAPGSHDAKALVNVLETYPRDELFQASEEQLFRNAIGVLHLMTRPRTRLFVRPDRFGRFMSCLVYVPRERYNTELRVRIGEILSEAFNGRVAAWTPSFGSLGDEALARIHFVIATRPGHIPDYDVEEIEARIVNAVRSWSDLLKEALIERLGEHEGNRLHARYGLGFDAAYRDSFAPVAAIADIEKMEEVTAERPFALRFYRRLEDPERAVRLKLYHWGTTIPLSDCLPVLENMGFRVVEEHPFDVRRDGGEEIWIHDFYMESVTGSEIDLSALRAKLEEAFTAIWGGAVDNDRLNRLVLLAGLEVREAALLRAYARYLRQAAIPYSFSYMQEALAAFPEITRQLVALFGALFDPRQEGDADARESRGARIGAAIREALEAVESLDYDRIFRRFLNAIEATLRTNYYQPDADGRAKSYLSLKLDSGRLEGIPRPKPWREIFVYATFVEGVHLRGGPVARGGIRWSDRREDYRTEVLGLLKAQMVKNAIIVPVGAKGGFLPKALPAGGTREEVLAEAVRCYRTYLRGLLDITDNLRGGDVVPPADVVRRDGDDPYLVVAADKGTATFSDYANEIAAEYGFWLGDAFASGGSNGYDHKAMGITARGAWEAVKRHFRELGRDIQSEPFTVIGIGDMSGDVFGNGMLLSRQIRLLAAFDHRDIFIDPDPDPAKSYAERERLFRLPRSSWQDYDRKLISGGGGVFSRRAKAIALTPQIKALTGLKADQVTPNELIHALLKAEADLMWFGGIGTYIKASTESHAEVGDRANDAIRVDAPEVRVRVIGEGANLGVTQRGRVEMALRGVKLNTDAVDNSAGVDCSDHEVNIKIALDSVVAAGDLTVKQRNRLLREMTDEVAELVLADNYHQTLAISLVEARAPALLEEHARFIRALEQRELLDRQLERLPDDAEIAERAKLGRGLTRPEIAVLVAYAKIHLFARLLESEVPDDPWMERLLIDYFPAPMRRSHRAALERHRLRREIIATVAANAFVNQAGPSLYLRLAEESGADEAETVRAYLIVREVFGLDDAAAEINALDNRIAAAVQIDMHLGLADMVAAHGLRLLQAGAGRSIGEALELYGAGVREIEKVAERHVAGHSKRRFARRVAELTRAKAPKALATRIARFELLGGAFDVIETARAIERPVADVAANYFAAAARFDLDWLRSAARSIQPRTHWERIALGQLLADLRAQQAAIAAAALRHSGAAAGPASVRRWAESHRAMAERVERLMAELRAAGELSVAKLAVAASMFRALHAC